MASSFNYKDFQTLIGISTGLIANFTSNVKQVKIYKILSLKMKKKCTWQTHKMIISDSKIRQWPATKKEMAKINNTDNSNSKIQRHSKTQTPSLIKIATS